MFIKALFLVTTILLGTVRSGYFPGKFTIDTALRSLSKGVFSNAILSRNGQVVEILKDASIQDTNECIKKLICEVQSIPRRDRTWDEQKIVETFPPKLSYTSPTIQLELAAKLGREQPLQCSSVYSRCAFDKEQLMTLIRQRGMSLTIPTTPDYECTVIFLWSKKKNPAEPPKTKDITNLLDLKE